MTWASSVIIDPNKTDTYGVASGFITPAAATTDMFTLSGEAGFKIELLKALLNYDAVTNSSTAKTKAYLLKRSALNTGGTSTAENHIPFNSASPASGAIMRSYTANPAALGALVNTSGRVCTGAFMLNALNAQSPTSAFVLFDHSLAGDAPKLVSATELLAVNFNGVIPDGTTPLVQCAFIYRRSPL